MSGESTTVGEEKTQNPDTWVDAALIVVVVPATIVLAMVEAVMILLIIVGEFETGIRFLSGNG